MADRAVLPGGVVEQDPVYVTVEGGRISGVFRGRSSAPAVTDYPTLHTPLLCPGLVDTHTHGLGESRGRSRATGLASPVHTVLGLYLEVDKGALEVITECVLLVFSPLRGCR